MVLTGFSIVYLTISVLVYRCAIRPIWKQKHFAVFYFSIISILILCVFMSFEMINQKMPIGFKIRNIAGGILVTLLLTKLWILFSYLLIQIINFFHKIIKRGKATEQEKKSRRKFLSKLALASAMVPFSSLSYGIFKGRYNFYVKKQTLYFPNLPEAFDGYQITHISDIHCGSFDSKNPVLEGIDMVNKQKSDVILFTGDLVNERSDEFLRWKEVFVKLSAPDGVFSVLGNHDYSEYTVWDSEEDKLNDQQALRRHQTEMGWKLLLNEHHILKRGNDKIALVGVENWGRGRFMKKGDLNAASHGLDTNGFKILMSHDPSHWDAQIRHHPKNFQLTLSGHTHGMQFGIHIPGLIKWSPVKYFYKQWDGLYKTHNHFIHVNRGFGTIGFPGRLGIWPEVSVLALKKS